MKKLLTTNSVRSFVFGVEDSLVSTIGLISGIAIIGAHRSTIIITGIILVTVEAFSMAVGILLSDNSAAEFKKHSNVAFSESFFSAIVMFVSYVCAGVMVLLPYLFVPEQEGFPISIGLSLIALFLLGVVSAIFSGIHPIKKGLLMVFIGGFTILIGVAVGLLLNNSLGLV